MRIDYYADPACPFSWITSRWLVAAAPAGGHEVVMRSFSLKMLNEGNDDVSDEHASAHDASTPVLRVLEAVRKEAGDDAVGRLYTELGRRHHHEGDKEFAGLPDALAAAGLDTRFADAADDEHWDEAVRTSYEEAQALMDGDAASPVTAFPETGRAFWGPVLRKAPLGQEGVRLLDAVLALAAEPAFSQLKAPLGGKLEMPPL